MHSLILLTLLLGAAPNVESGSLLFLQNADKIVDIQTGSEIDHVAMIVQIDGHTWVYEATPPKVRRLKLKTYCHEIAKLNQKKKDEAVELGQTLSDQEKENPRVLENLISNALKFSPPGGTVRLSLHQTPRNIRISVQDQGPPIPPEYQKKIFDKFGQVEARMEQQKFAAGLGLVGHAGVSPSSGPGSRR